MSRRPDSRPAVVLYGATGYTGRLIAERAAQIGLDLLLAGRRRSALSSLSHATGYDFRVAALDDSQALAEALTGARVLLNAAGPFSRTAAPLIATCLARSISYLDLSGEVDAIELVAAHASAARAACVMLMPGVGFDVVPSDCLANRLLDRLPDADQLRIAICGLDGFSRGSARSMLELVGRPIRVRRNGRLVSISTREPLRKVDYGNGPRVVRPVDWAELVTAYVSTGIANVTTYIEDRPTLRWGLWSRKPYARGLSHPSLQLWLQTMADVLPDGPSDEYASRAPHAAIVASLEMASGPRVCAAYETGDVYRFSAASACEVARRCAAGDFEPGFQTPARVYGSALLRGMPGQWIETATCA